jgi:pimeloyl-ACP methyl ester carboxylesterase
MRKLLGCAFLALLAFAASVLAESASFDSAGVKIHYTVEGQGEPVILIHGFIANANLQWRAPGIIKELAKHYQVIALDNRGHGLSDKPHGAEKYGVQMVEDVIRLMDHLRIQKAHVVGYSLGAFITGKLMTLHPDRVRSATLGGAAFYRGTISEPLEQIATALENGQGVEPLLAALTPEGEPKPGPEQIKALNQIVLAFNDPKALAAVARGMKELSVPDDALRNNKVPALVLIGDKDPLKAGVEPLRKARPDIGVHYLDGATHMDAFTRPEFTKKLLEFLKSVDAANSGLKKAG